MDSTLAYVIAGLAALVSIVSLIVSVGVAKKQINLQEQEWVPRLSYGGMSLRINYQTVSDADTSETVAKKTDICLVSSFKNVGRCSLQYKITGFTIRQTRMNERNEVLEIRSCEMANISGFLLNGGVSCYSTEGFTVEMLDKYLYEPYYGEQIFTASTEFICKFHVEFWSLHESDSKFSFDVEGSVYVDNSGNSQDSTKVVSVTEPS